MIIVRMLKTVNTQRFGENYEQCYNLLITGSYFHETVEEKH
jgi:hypothetical protein